MNPKSQADELMLWWQYHYEGEIKQLASLLNVTKQALYKWRKRGIPKKYHQRIADIGFTCKPENSVE